MLESDQGNAKVGPGRGSNPTATSQQEAIAPTRPPFTFHEWYSSFQVECPYS